MIMDQRAAFARARRFLNYNRVAKWSALLAAVGTGVLYVGLLVVLGLFADLLINRGQIPAYRDLTPHQQEEFQTEWQSREDRRQVLADFGIQGEDLAKLDTNDFDRLSPKDKNRCWQAHVYELLRDRVDDYAAETYKDQVTPRERGRAEQAGEKKTGDQPAPPGERGRATDLGVLSLVVHSQNALNSSLVGWLASWNPWMWDPDEGATAYLTWLLVLALGLALLRGVLMFVLNYSAALATVEAATRLRRAIYHHTFRLGTLAFRALGPSEAVGVFTRHLEAVHDALYAWLTVVFREPVKFALLLAFALLINFWLALAFVGFAVLVWLVGGQIAAFFRRQGRIANQRAADQLTLIQESLMLMRLVKVYLMELFNQSRVERQLSRYAAAQMQRLRGEAIYRPLLVFLGLLAALVLLYAGGRVVLYGRLGVASAIVLATALVSLYWPLSTWLEIRRYLRRGRDSAAALFKFLDRPGGLGQVVEAEFLPALSKQ